MRVVVFGATGAQGRRALAGAAATAGLDSIVAVSRDPGRAAAAAASCVWGAARVSPAVADITAPGTLAALLRSDDFVLNAAAPFYSLGNDLARACIVAGAHYADICDDWEATVTILALDRDARKRGVTLVTGFGSAPGLDNMLAMAAGSALDRVDTLVTAWSLGGGGDGPSSAIPYQHLLKCCVGPIRLVRGGTFVDETPLQPVRVVYPGAGAISAWTIGSPEAVTLWSAFPSSRLGLNLVRAPPETIEGLRALATMIRSGGLDIEAAAEMLMSAGDASIVLADAAPRLFALAEGKRDGSSVTVGAELSGFPEGGYTSAGAALGAAVRLRADGGMRAPGAFSIEASVAAGDYLRCVAAAIDPNAPTPEIRLRLLPMGASPR